MFPERSATYVSGSDPRYDGATSRTRTDDLRFTKPLLYQLSYRGSTRTPVATLPISKLAHAIGAAVSADAAGGLGPSLHSARRT